MSASVFNPPVSYQLFWDLILPIPFILKKVINLIMVSSLFINPFSEDARDLVREHGSLDGIKNDTPELLEAVKHTRNQNIDDDTLIPRSIMELAVKRIEWYMTRRTKGFNHKNYAYLFNPEIEEYDVLAFYVAAQAAGSRFKPGSREARVVVESTGALIGERLKVTGTHEKGALVDDVMAELGSEHLRWVELADIIETRKLKLTDLILDGGYVVIEREDFLERFQERIDDRDPEKFYQLLVGTRVREAMITGIIMQMTEDYIRRVHEMSSNVEVHPLIGEVADEIARTISSSTFSFTTPSGKPIKAGKLLPEAFPPCIRATLEGVKSGNRNDAIVLLLTSFISYARLYPSVFKERASRRVSDFDPDLKITLGEILPIIYAAADKCEPPLFDDDPQEKLNITAKLGFGVHETPEPENEGESKWYTPMSCEKIKIHLPTLCRPDDTCERISNPLSYYNRRRWELRSGGAGGKEDTEAQSDEKREGA